MAFYRLHRRRFSAVIKVQERDAREGRRNLMSHEEEYQIAKRKYEDAFAEKRSAENEISGIINRRRQILDTVNELVAERKLNDASLTELNSSSAKNSDFDDCVKDTETKLEAASAGFCAIGESSLGVPQKLTEVFDEKNRRSKSSITGAFEQIKNIGKAVQQKIDDLNSRISALEREQEDGQNRERYLNGVISEQDHRMSNATIEMAYHKRHMDED